jgi:hypothetical protein
VTLCNPLPKITFAELAERARVPLRQRKRANHPVFALDLRYSTGEDAKTTTLLPGETLTVPETFAAEVADPFKPVDGLCGANPGLAVVKEGGDSRSAAIDALHIAEQHYHLLGSQQLDAVRTARGHRDEEVERYRGSVYSSYFLAMAKEELIRKQREELEASPDAIPTEAPINETKRKRA